MFCYVPVVVCSVLYYSATDAALPTRIFLLENLNCQSIIAGVHGWSPAQSPEAISFSRFIQFFTLD